MNSRPTSFDQMVLTDVVRRLLTAASNLREATSLLFHGGPGVGKTSAIDCLCNAIQDANPGFSKHRDVLSLNASDDRGLDTVRSTISSFVAHGHGNGIPKVLVLDEIDAMTLPAQRTLATVMSKHNSILLATCNYLCKVDMALRDMCVLVQMPSPDAHMAVGRLAAQTKVTYELAQHVYSQTAGDLRAAKNYCGLIRSLDPGTDFLTPEQRLNHAVIGLCQNHSTALTLNREVRRELETLLTATKIPVEYRRKVIEELVGVLNGGTASPQAPMRGAQHPG